MKRLILLPLFVFLATAMFAQNNTKDEIAIKNIIRQQESAWNRHDWDALSSYFTADATLINFVGQFWKGRDEILAHFRLLSECCLEPTSLKFEFKQARFLSPGIAIVYTEETLFADKDYDVPFRQYKKGDIDYKWKIDVFVKEKDEWKVKSTQMTLINQMISPHNAQKNIREEKAIEEQIDAFFTSWNTHDFSDMKNYVAGDCDFVNVAGMHWKGREDIQYAHTRVHEQIFKDKPLRKLSAGIRFLTGDVAIAHVLMHLEGDFTTPDGSGKTNPDALATFVFLNKNDRWLITAVENVFVDEAAKPFDPVTMRNNQGNKKK